MAGEGEGEGEGGGGRVHLDIFHTRASFQYFWVKIWRKSHQGRQFSKNFFVQSGADLVTVSSCQFLGLPAES